MKIILGVFGDDFNRLRDEHDAIEFYDNKWVKTDDEHINNPFNSGVCHSVCHNLDACTECVFDVTNLKLPFNEGVITLKELYIVIHNQEYFDKTTFYVDCKQINKDKLKELFLINEAIAFKDYAELFNQN